MSARQCRHGWKADECPYRFDRAAPMGACGAQWQPMQLGLDGGEVPHEVEPVRVERVEQLAWSLDGGTVGQLALSADPVCSSYPSEGGPAGIVEPVRVQLADAEVSAVRRILARGEGSPYRPVFTGAVRLDGSVAVFDLVSDAEAWESVRRARPASTPTRSEPSPCDVDDVIAGRQVAP